MTVSISGTNGLVFNDASTQNTAATGFGFKNRIINGAMTIAQRGTSSLTQTGAFQYPVDRFLIYGDPTSKFTSQQNAGSVTPPAGFKNYLGITSSSAYSVGSADVFVVAQQIEGYNVADLAWGTASAASVTLSFRVYSSLTGTFGGSLRNGAGNRSYPFTYSIPVANTWTTVSVTVSGDTTGTWATDNSVGLAVWFGLGIGSASSGTAGAWAGASYFSATGATSVVGTNGATFYITGVQLEKGSTATSFDYRPYGTELALCQRYYARLQAGTSAYTGFGSGLAYSTTNATIFIKYPVTMRSSPSLSGANLGFNDGLVSNAVTAINASYLGTDSGIHQFTSSGLTQYRPYILAGNNSTSAYIDLSSEL
jgi:hypothetical protein